ncbi:peptidase [Pseudomonas sp. WS 5079]|uniref:peptidase n=1 Tax=Pseudomonas sp. WS 5079 TaxID=2717492 RepID=UPI0021CD026B|nr:peptidase [Pseudomonas sp. WS 5079]
MNGVRFDFSEADLAATVKAYDPALHEAPLVIGHPKHDAPAAGWVKSLTGDAQGLNAEPQQVDPAFSELLAKKSFKKISASFYHPDAANNPVPGVYYLRHVGFLGAQPPAVKGLRPIELADGEEGVIEFGDFGDSISAGVFRRLREWLIAQFGQEAADQVVPGWDVDNLLEESRRDNDRPAFSDPPQLPPKPTEEQPVNEAEKTALEAENKRLSTLVDQHQTKARTDAAATRHTANLAFAEGLVSAGRLLPKHADALIAVLDFAEAGDTPLEFGEGDQRAPVVDGLKAIFNDLPQQIDFAEQASKDRKGDADSPMDMEFAEKNTDPGRLGLHNRASALATEKNIPYESAVRQLINK